MLHCLLAPVTFGPQESKGEWEAPCSQKFSINNDRTISNSHSSRPIKMNPKTCSQLTANTFRTPRNPFRCSMLAFDKGWRRLISILVRNKVRCQCHSNYHLAHNTRLTSKLRNICFDGRHPTERWRLDMTAVLSIGQRDHMR